MLFSGLNDAQKRWLINMKITHVAAISNSITVLVHIASCYTFVFVLDMGIAGLGLAMFTSSVVTFILCIIHTCLLSDIQESVFLPNIDSIRGLKPFILIGVKMIAMMMTFVFALELRMIFAGQLGDSEVAATAVLVNIAYSIQMIGQGVQITNIALFGNLLGENQPEIAWRMYKVNMYPWISLFALISILMITYRDSVSMLFSGDTEAKYIEEEAMVWSSLFVFLTCSKMCIQSPFAAMKRQNILLTTSIIDFFIIGLPLSALMAFNMGMGVNGLFLGGCIGTLVGTAIQIGHLCRIDVVEEA